MWNGMEGFGWGWMGFGMISMLLFWIAIILCIVALMKWLGGGTVSSDLGPPSSHSRTALEILGERYARGEIGKDEFEQKKRDLR